MASYGLTLAGAPSSVPYGNLADATIQSPTFTDIDPLLLDISGNGINVSNWINNAVYFQTNTKQTTVGTVVSTIVDPNLHHTSWTLPGTGMLVFDPSGGAVSNISQIVSEDLSTNGTTIGNFSDSLAALKSLATAGAASFTSATALVDPTTHNSYYSELRVWQDANDNGVALTSQIYSHRLLY